jgi:hypothetical protein
MQTEASFKLAINFFYPLRQVIEAKKFHSIRHDDPQINFPFVGLSGNRLLQS